MPTAARSISKPSPRRKTADAQKTPAAKPAPARFIPLLLTFATVILAALPSLLPHVDSTQTSAAQLMPFLIWGGSILLSALLLKSFRFNGDWTLFWITALLLGLGTTLQHRLGTTATDWTLWLSYVPYFLGLSGLLFLSLTLNPKRLQALLPSTRWLLWCLALIPLAALLLFGRRYRGGIFLPGNINPSELTKAFLILFTAGWLPKILNTLSNTLCGLPFPPLKTLLALAFAWGIPLAIVASIGDFGMILILCLTLVILLTAITRKYGWLLLGAGAMFLAGLSLQLFSSHTRTRLEIWLDPFKDPDGKGYQMGQSLCAQYAGQLFGTGIAKGHPEYIPIVESDFIYAAIAEEWGLVGCALLLCLYLLWFQRMSATSNTSPVNQTLALGIAALLGSQTLLNIAGITKALPMTGIPLPLLSLGGSSLIATLLLVGIALANTKQAR